MSNTTIYFIPCKGFMGQKTRSLMKDYNCIIPEGARIETKIVKT